MQHNGTSPDDGPLPNRDSLKNGGIKPDPDIVLYHDRLAGDLLRFEMATHRPQFTVPLMPFIGRERMGIVVEDLHPVGHEHTMADRDIRH